VVSGSRGDGGAGGGEDQTHLYPPEPRPEPGGPAPARPRGAPAGPPPPAEAFRPSGPPPPADSFRPATGPAVQGRPGPTPGGRQPVDPEDTWITNRASGGDRMTKSGPGGGAAPRDDRLGSTAAYEPAFTELPDQAADDAAGAPGAEWGSTGQYGSPGYGSTGEYGAPGQYGAAGYGPPGAPTGTVETPAPPRRRGRRRRILLIGLVSLIVLLLIADRVGAVEAKSAMRKKIVASVAQSAGPGTKPPIVENVQVRGFPFLTQVLFGKYKDIRLTLDQIPTPGPEIERVSARLQGLHVPFSAAIRNKVGKVPVDKVSGTVAITYAELNKYLATAAPSGLTVTLAPADGGKQVESTATVTKEFLARQGVTIPDVGGLNLPGGLGNSLGLGSLGLDGPFKLGGTSTFQVTDNKLTLKLSSLKIVGVTIPGVSAIPDIPLSLPISGLPFHLQIVDAHSTSSGLEVSATATDVVLPAS
jgi:LmeA-like phospholipid-binding